MLMKRSVIYVKIKEPHFLVIPRHAKLRRIIVVQTIEVGTSTGAILLSIVPKTSLK